MKHLFLPLLLLTATASAQLPYDITVFDQPYAPLSEATALEMDQYDYMDGWDDPEFSVQIGFDFDFSGYVIDALDQVGVGSLMMGTTIDPKSGLPLLHGFIPTNFDLADLGMAGGEPSIIRWQTSGAPGERVFTMEWANAGLYEEVFADSALKELSHLNVQLRLYESDGVIEYHFGPSSIPTDLDEPVISGLLLQFDPFSYDGTVYALDGDESDPTLVLLPSIDDWYYGPYLFSHPADGTVYRFGPTGAPLEMVEEAEAALRAWPNPTSGGVQLDFNGAHDWTLTDAVGREVMNGTALCGVRLDLEELDGGTYLFRLDDGRVERLVRH